MFELIEETLDAVALFVQFGVVDALALAVSFWRDDDFRSRFGDPLTQMIGVVALVGQKGAGFDSFDKFVRQGDVVALTRTGDQADRKTEGFGCGMDFRA